MKQYDCIVYGDDIYGLIVSVFLARKMRNVLVIQDSSKFHDDFEIIDIVDPENNKYHFEYNPKGIISGLDKQGLTYEYLNGLGLFDVIKTFKISEDIIIDKDNNLRNRIHTFPQFRVYLVRYYPKSRSKINKFFEDLERHYENYMEQFVSMLRNTSYTLTSLMIEWGDYSLNELLNKYFDDEDLKKEFSANSFINGLDSKEVNSYSFFSNYFVGLKSGFYYLESSEKELRKILLQKLLLINPNAIIKTKVKKFNLTEDKKIKSIVDKDNKEYFSKIFFVENNPVKFYSKYFKDKTKEIETIKAFYPNLEEKQYINTMYLAINKKPKFIGIENLIYYFNNNKETDIKIVKLFNYYMYKKSKKNGLLCIDFVYKEGQEYSIDKLLKRISDIFPKLKKSVVGVRIGKPRLFSTMLSKENVRKNLSINELIDIEELEHIMVFENLYIGYKSFRPESGLYGIINQAILMGDKIEDRLYFGEDNDTHPYLNNEEIMMMIRHNYNDKIFGNKEIHVNFHISKNTYFVRIKAKNIVIHHGKYSKADVSIYTTNDTLSNLLLKKITFLEALNGGSLKYRGNKDVLMQVVNAFKLDDYQEYNPLEYKKSKYKNLGARFIITYLGIYFIASLLSNYVNGIIIYPVALFISLTITYLKYRSYEEIVWFDIFINFTYLTGIVLSIVWPTFNTIKSDFHLLGLMSFVMLSSVFLLKKPIIYNYTKFDKNIDYRNSSLFKIISNGLTFIWGILLLTILVSNYILGIKNLTVFYNLYFVGVFLMFYYPIIYVNTNIKQ